jgi:hypothetical protein
MIGAARGVSTLLGAAIAGFLLWLATQFDVEGSTADYWATLGLCAAAGLAMALSQVLGGWTKWGEPRLSRGVFLLGFLPALVAGGWVLLAAMPADWGNTSNWSRDLGIGGIVDDLAVVATAIAFGLGLILGLCFDTAPRRVRAAEPVAPKREEAVADEPLTAERGAAEREPGEPAEQAVRRE